MAKDNIINYIRILCAHELGYEINHFAEPLLFEGSDFNMSISQMSNYVPHTIYISQRVLSYLPSSQMSHLPDRYTKHKYSHLYQEKKIDTRESLNVLSPINDKVLKYLAENPEALYQLSSNNFEMVMAEIYSKLGYDVTRTQATRDGGKDIIIRKKEILGDFIYYVECKKHAPKRHIGVGIVKNLVATVDTDKVNGGILATTSFFTEDARKFILDNKWNCQIQMHDYIKIQNLLNMTI